MFSGDFDIKFESVDNFITLRVQWCVLDSEGETLPAWSTGSGETLSEVEEILVGESVGPVWLEWLGSWGFGVICDLHGVQDLSDHDGTDHKVSICHEIPIKDRDRSEYAFRDNCHTVRAIVTVTTAGGTGLDTGWQVV